MLERDSPNYELSNLGQPVNDIVPGWVPPPVPERRTLNGRFCRVEPLDPAMHAESLWAANCLDSGCGRDAALKNASLRIRMDLIAIKLD
jgi:hypothetical protein